MGLEMIVTCRSSQGSELPADYRGLYFSKQTVFHVVPGREYRVHEMSLFNSGLIILIVDSTGQPNWYPIELFEVADARLPEGWIFALREGDESGTIAIWGHPRLVNDPALDEALADQDDGARQIFWREVVPASDE
jgi:hypothetical protein